MCHKLAQELKTKSHKTLSITAGKCFYHLMLKQSRKFPIANPTTNYFLRFSPKFL